jgi:hypothetical protein
VCFDEATQDNTLRNIQVAESTTNDEPHCPLHFLKTKRIKDNKKPTHSRFFISQDYYLSLPPQAGPPLADTTIPSNRSIFQSLQNP